MPAHILGSIILAVPALAIAWALLWRRHTPIFWFAAALILVGIGYLSTTGAVDDVARAVAPNLIAPAKAPAS